MAGLTDRFRLPALAGGGVGFLLATRHASSYARARAGGLDGGGPAIRLFYRAGLRSGWRTRIEARAVYDSLPARLRMLGPREAVRNLRGFDWSHRVPHAAGGTGAADNGIFERAWLNRKRGAVPMTAHEVEAASRDLARVGVAASLPVPRTGERLRGGVCRGRRIGLLDRRPRYAVSPGRITARQAPAPSPATRRRPRRARHSPRPRWWARASCFRRRRWSSGARSASPSVPWAWGARLGAVSDWCRGCSTALVNPAWLGRTRGPRRPPVPSRKSITSPASRARSASGPPARRRW